MSRDDRGPHGDAGGAGTLTDELRKLIVSGVYPPGHRLIQEELADRFGVSRIPLREAIRTLSSEGLLVTKPGQGTFVTQLDLDEIDEIYNLRRLIEPSFAEHVTDRVSRRDISRFEAMVAHMDRVEEVGADSWSRTNLAFHLDMYRLARLPLRYEIIAQMYHRLEPYSRFYVHGTSAYGRVQCEHSAMVRALADGDAEELARQIVAHIDGGQRGLHAAWENSSDTIRAYWAESTR
ncbi:MULTISPECIES: GntR family transcriptional regulator [Streptomyces]|uniref:GntR family transcriptional regulator n=2 Tax=Streptomyces TaxID=1883 RepID=UPI00099EDA52|nr:MULTISPECIES: GntR family transcriptional regulator [Streptomyces]MBW8086957.1 GntR family transcriptional regulator [Streptomyces hygroscopicus subsp. hygroscopicus]MDN3054880.1 GntR family transcriptional regulator [Streptomyces sp. SRF1]